MARSEIILGTPPTGIGGDTPRVASSKINAMTTELYAATGGLVKVASPTDITPGRLVTPAWMGLGTTEAPAIADCNLARCGGKYKGYGLLNAPLQGIVTLDVTGYTDNWISQTLRDVSDKPRVFERSWYGGNTWSTWLEVYTAGNAAIDPAIGGLMSSTVVNGFTIDKYANGVMVVTTPNTNTPTIAATDIAITVISLPVSFVPIEPLCVQAMCWPLVTLDCYGVVCQEILNLSSVRYAIRNGGTAQIFRTGGCRS